MNRSRLSSLLDLLFYVVALISLAYMLNGLVRMKSEMIMVFSDTNQMTLDMGKLAKDVENLTVGQDSLSKAVVGVKEKSIEGRLEAIESAIGQSPEKILAIISIRKDLDNLQSGVKARDAELQARLQKAEDANAWTDRFLMGGLLSIVVIFIGKYVVQIKT